MICNKCLSPMKLDYYKVDYVCKSCTGYEATTLREYKELEDGKIYETPCDSGNHLFKIFMIFTSIVIVTTTIAIIIEKYFR